MVHASMEFVDPLAHGSVLLDLPFDPDFPQLSDDEFGWISAPSSPEDRHALSPDLFHGFQVDQVLLSRSQDKSDALSWDSILHGIENDPVYASTTNPHVVAKTPTVPAAAPAVKPALIGGVMWDGSDGEDMGPPPLRSFFHGLPTSREDMDFQHFIQDDVSSSDEEIHIIDGELRVKRRKVAPTPAQTQAAQIQAKKAKLAALRQANKEPVKLIGDELINMETPEGKRHTHNVLERKRREDLKISYQELRLQVPELVNAERAPTGQILIKAAEYIAKLKAEEEEMVAQLAVMRVQNANLKRLRQGASS